MIPEVYDMEDGINLVFDFENGLALTVYMDDECAQQMIDIIQNKLNSRIK